MIDIRYIIEQPDDEVFCACELIRRFADKNSMELNLEVAYDFTLEDECGCFYPQLDKDKIFINPFVSMETYAIAKDKGMLMAHGFTSDLSLFSIVIHEFAHLVCYRIHKGLVEEYMGEFPSSPRDRLYLNDYCDHTLDDEVAESLTLYILNPLLLKLISKRHWKFYNSRFKSAVPCSHQQMLKIYKDFPVDAKLELYDKYGITYNVNTKQFEIIEKDQPENVLQYKPAELQPV